MTKTFCDRCEKEIRSEQERAEIKYVQSTNKSLYKLLCQPCFTALESFLNNK